MRALALALSFLAASSAAAFALTEADLSQPEQQLLAAVKADSTASVQGFMATRAYVHEAQAAVKDPAAAAIFGEKPEGFGVRYLLKGDADTINQAVSANVASMAMTLWG